MILSLINDGNTTLNVRSERTRQGGIPCKSNLFWENDIAKSALSFIMQILTNMIMVSCFIMTTITRSYYRKESAAFFGT